MPQARNIPDTPPEWKQKQPKPDLGRSYAIELITPMVGGGVETRVNDPSFPIRATSIRGQLQFWWRATVGAQYATRQELRAAQSAIWGNTEQASKVQVRVEDVQAAKPSPCALIEWDQHARGGQGGWRTNWQAPFNGNGSALPYALFPFQGETPPPNRSATVTVPPASCIHKASFKLTLICHKEIDFAKEIEPALWAWVNFGGLGSRTRRGCGAIVCKALAPKDRNELLARLKTFLQAPNAQSREWPTLAAAFLVGGEQAQGEQVRGSTAWNEVVKLFRDFRQGVDLGRDPGTSANQPGRSRWPEPETIRRVTGRRASFRPRQPHIPDDAFPRGELGLPIVFHFKDEKAGDPRDTVLYPDNDSDSGCERMASPLILKPLALANGKFVPLIVRLKTPTLTGVDLRQGERSLPLPQPTVIRDPKLANYRHSPMQNRSPNGSALEAFLAYAKSQGFAEVTR
jgi:CRISPR-associated protein Cmr1